MSEDLPRAYFINPTTDQIHDVEQRYAGASTLVDEVVAALVHDAGIISEKIGLSDASSLFQYIFSFIHEQHRTDPRAVMRTTAICAAALTRLARIKRGEEMDMSQFEEGTREL